MDHIDGLYDPQEYLERLQAALRAARGGNSSESAYVLVEKILAGDEALPMAWPIAGATGYEFLGLLNGLFVDHEGLGRLVTSYQTVTGQRRSFGDLVYQTKLKVMRDLFAAEVRGLAKELGTLAKSDGLAHSLAQSALTQALVHTTANLSVYRTYTRDSSVNAADRRVIEDAILQARQRVQSLDAGALGFLARILTLRFGANQSREQRDAWLRFVQRWQQFTGPVTAKGVEDTAFYRYTPLLSLNEVGCDPGSPETSLEAFHRANAERQRQWPGALNATATHDTKRGEDARARLNALSEVPAEWERHLRRWMRWNHGHKSFIENATVPGPHVESFLYQTLVSAWPTVGRQDPTLIERLKRYLVKAAREAKLHTSWLAPNEEYESALTDFTERILQRSPTNKFLPDFLGFQRQVAKAGVVNSLAQIVLKIASPGVPDFYQGTELWDLSLVDPDNRRLVDFSQRIQALRGWRSVTQQTRPGLVRDLVNTWVDGRIKMYVITEGLALRNRHAAVFASGDYIPLTVHGVGRRVCAFARRLENTWVVCAAPRLASGLLQAQTPLFRRGALAGGGIQLPQDAPGRWTNTFTGEAVETQTLRLDIPGLFRRLPVTLLVADNP